MSFPSLSQARIVDPLLTTIAHGFRQPEFVGSLAFPPVQVKKRQGKILRFNEDEFFLHQVRRSPGSSTLRVSGGWGSDTYELFQDSIEEELPMEHLEEASDLPIDLQRRSIEKAMRRIGLRLEFDQMALLGSPSSYPSTNQVALTGTAQFSNPASDPESVMDIAANAVLAACGMLPNTILFGYRAFLALKRHPTTRDKIKYTTSNSVTLDILLAQYNVARGGISAARWIDPASPAAGRRPMAMDNAIAVLYVPDAAVNGQVGSLPSPDADMGMPSFGYTYQLEGYPIAEQPYYERNTKTWYFPNTAERAPVLTGMGAGYLIFNVAA